MRLGHRQRTGAGADDTVLAIGQDHEQREIRRIRQMRQDQLGDPLAREMALDLVGLRPVLAERRAEADRDTTARRDHGLVQPLAARRARALAADQRLAGQRQARHGKSQIEARIADHDDTAHRLFFRDVGRDHLPGVDDTIELRFAHIAELERRLLQGEIVVGRVMGDLRRLVVADHRRQRRHQHQRALDILSDLLAVWLDRKSTRLNSSHLGISYAVFCLKKKKKTKKKKKINKKKKKKKKNKKNKTKK